MEAALQNKPAIPFRVPPGLQLVRVDSRTGKPVRKGSRGVILEAFLPGTAPTSRGGSSMAVTATRNPALALRLPRVSFAVYVDCIKL